MKLSEAELGRYRYMAEAAAVTEHELWEAAGVAAGAAVADLGCGPGAMSVVLARLVGPGGRVVAVDGDPSAVEAAREGVAAAGLGNVTVAQGDAADTGIEPGSVDVVMIRHVLAHNGGREEAIVAHAARLVRPGGAVYVVDVDLSATRVRPSDPDVEELSERYLAWHAGRGNDPSVGLRLADLLTGAGLDVVDYQGRYQIVAVPVGMRPPAWAARDFLMADGLATPAEVERWSAALERVDAEPRRPTLFAPLFLALGRRPPG